MPTGTVTFLFTDLESSTRLWEEHPDAMRGALARHDTIVQGAIGEHDGVVVKTTGDGVHAAFATARDAVGAAVAAQLALQHEPWEDTGALRVRIGLHTGVCELRDGDYYGTAVNRAARLMAVAHGSQIVCSQVTADLVDTEPERAITFLDLGEHRLRDLGAPQRIFQVAHAELRADFPELRSLDSYPGNLPLQLSAFVGRDDELAELSKLLPRERLVTITGTGGVGKTRLALQAAAAALPAYPDGAWFVDLAPVSDPDYVATEIATTMALPEHRQGSAEDALMRALAHRDALVVLDNCEHLVDAAARVADLIVRRCPNITLLATSQETLGVEGEATFGLRPLPVGDAGMLFAERAAAARHGFDLSGDNVITVAELCRRLDGIPLAIELAAARVASMSPHAILERIDERFRLLAQGRRTARARHQTLRAAVEWSYGLLEPDEQTVFDRLSVFAGDFTLEAAESVVSDEAVDTLDVLDLLAGLVAKSMVLLDDTGTVDHYRLLETMRDFGQERLADPGELPAFEARHAAYYLDLVVQAEPGYLGRDDTAWCERVTSEYANVRAALAWTREHDPAEHEKFVFSLVRFWRNTGQLPEGFAWITGAMPIHGPAAPSQRADALAAAGSIAVNFSRYDQGLALFEQSLACSAEAGEPPRSLALTGLGLVALQQSRPDDAQRFGEESVRVARADGHPYLLAEALAAAGLMTGLTSDDPRAVEFADEGLSIARDLGNRTLLTAALEAAGMARYRTDPRRAIGFFDESLALGRPTGVVDAQTRFIKAVAHLTLREPAASAAELCIALPLMRENGGPYYQSMALGLAAALLTRADTDVAVRNLAVVDRLREDGVFIGAPRDVEMQLMLRHRFEEVLGPERFTALWAEGRAMALDDAIAVTLDDLAVLADAG
ncbi:MAG TPA: adenylate/guanylate cyclase domain-containing protein [Acidimicrobiia bacterium]|nr:adenylate/guanylate cyclase domain-containing protein [Acidimicrobiia bacterium]